MLPSSNRLNLKKDFKWVRSGKGYETRLFRLFTKFGENDHARVGIATSSKTFKEATDRNRSRRLLSRAFEEVYQKLPANINIVALPKQGILEVKSKDVLLELEEVLVKEKLV